MDGLLLQTQIQLAMALSNAYVTVTPSHCHKALRHNAFITKARPISDSSYELIAEIDHVNEQHFFDHYIDHVPGMLIACIVRQTALVVSHLFKDVSLGHEFIMDTISMQYTKHAALNVPITVFASFKDIRYRASEFRGAYLLAELHQGGHKIASGELGFRVMNTATSKRLSTMKSRS